MAESTARIAESALAPRFAALRRAAIVAGVYFLVLGYPPLRLAELIAPGWRPGTPELLLLLVGPAAARLAREALPGPVGRAFLAAAYQWLGVCFVLLWVLVPWEIANLALDLPRLQSGQAIAALTGLLVLVGAVNAQVLRVRRERVGSSRIGEPLRLVQVSDVHVGSRGAGFLARVARRVRALDPDVVVVTGDLVDVADVPAQRLAPLAATGAPTFFVIGNHERYVDCDAICERLAGLGVRVLRDATEHVRGLRLVGIDDAEAKDQVERVLDRLDPGPGPFTVLLYHRPDGLESAARHGVDLMLCGHTHNGQIVPFNWLVRRVFPRIQGRFAHGATTLYVSPGTGTWGPTLRLGSRSEITVLDLEPEGPSPAPGGPARDARR